MGIVIKKKYELGDIRFAPKELEQFCKVIEGSILDNIQKQKQANGQQLKKNARSTQIRKRLAGRRPLSLVDEKHRFVKGNKQSWATEVVNGGKSILVRPATGELKSLMLSVQQMGYVGWFGVSERGKLLMRNLLKKLIIDKFKSFRKK